MLLLLLLLLLFTVVVGALYPCRMPTSLVLPPPNTFLQEIFQTICAEFAVALQKTSLETHYASIVSSIPCNVV
jgi:hypothetical protein